MVYFQGPIVSKIEKKRSLILPRTVYHPRIENTFLSSFHSIVRSLPSGVRDYVTGNLGNDLKLGYSGKNLKILFSGPLTVLEEW